MDLLNQDRHILHKGLDLVQVLFRILDDVLLLLGQSKVLTKERTGERNLTIQSLERIAARALFIQRGGSSEPWGWGRPPNPCGPPCWRGTLPNESICWKCSQRCPWPSPTAGCGRSACEGRGCWGRRRWLQILRNGRFLGGCRPHKRGIREASGSCFTDSMVSLMVSNS